MDFGDDIETLYIHQNIDIISKKKIKYYEYQLTVLNTIFVITIYFNTFATIHTCFFS